jgi:proteasome lid subunit RPN8/RPN11
VNLPHAVEAAIIDHARAESPHECCGLLIGTAGGVTGIFPARNIADEPERRYLVDPHDHLAAIKRARARGEAVVGAYHSHPQSRGRPSPTDAADAFTDFLFVIVGLGVSPPELTGWKWEDGNFTAVLLVRVP